jgi:glycosyltransferase involved in cell wall biosynthesis
MDATVSIIIPCRNEENFIAACLDSVLANDYPKDRIEVLVVDGMSEDRTRSIVEEYSRRLPFIRMLENPQKITPCAFNIGIRHSKGDLVMIMGAHSTYDRSYISKCARALEEYGADNVGGIMKTVPRTQRFPDNAIVTSLSHPFGVGSAHFRLQSGEPRWVDTVFGGCYKHEVFEKVGLFNEHLVSSQDMEFNCRLRKAGGRILMLPDIVSFYFARSGYRAFCKNNFRNGVWAILPFAYSEGMPVRLRHLVPLLFVAGLLMFGILGLIAEPFRWLFLLILTAYFLSNLTAAIHVAWKNHDFRYALLMPFIFASLHFAYGFGSLWGLGKLVATPQFWRKFFQVRKNEAMDLSI